MITYTYQCAAGAEFDYEQRITDPKLTECPVCENCTPVRLISGAPGFTLVSGPSGGWGSAGYAKPEHERHAEKQLGRPLCKAAK